MKKLFIVLSITCVLLLSISIIKVRVFNDPLQYNIDSLERVNRISEIKIERLKLEIESKQSTHKRKLDEERFKEIKNLLKD